MRPTDRESCQSSRHCYVLTMIAIVALVTAFATYSSACTLPAIPVNGFVTLPNGSRATLSTKVKANDIVQFDCIDEWELPPKVDRQMTCLKSGSWSGSVPECQKAMQINKSNWKKELVVKMETSFNCNVSISEMKLHSTGEAMHLCDLKDIAVLLCHGESGKSYSVGVKAFGHDIFNCDAPNHPTSSRSKTFTCNFNPMIANQKLEYVIIKTKDDESISFEEVHIARHKCDYCGMPPSLRNGTAKYVSFRKTHYECNRGFAIHGNEEIFCRTGKWSSMPSCEIMPSTDQMDGTDMATDQSSELVKSIKNGGSVPETVSWTVIGGIVFFWFIILMQ